MNKNIGRLHKPSVDILGAARLPRSSNSISNFENISNVENNFNFRHFNNDNNLRVGLIFKVSQSCSCKNSDFSSSKHSCTCTSSCIYDMVNDSNSDDYGLIPLQPLGCFFNKQTDCNVNMGYVDMHQLLCHTGVPNCIGEQILIQPDLNIPLWEQALHNNRDHQLIYFLKKKWSFLGIQPQCSCPIHKGSLHLVL